MLFVRLSLAFALVLGGCGAGLPEIVPVVSFPTADDLAPEIARGARDHGRADAAPEAVVAAYALPGGAPAFGAGNVPAGHGPVAQALAESGAARVVSTVGMACAAERLAAFIAQHGGQPPADLRDFILGRCGVTSVGAELLVELEPLQTRALRDVHGDGAGGGGALETELRRRLEGRPVPFEVEVGQADLEGAQHRVHVVVFAPRRAVVSASALPDGRYLIAGRVDGERVRALGAWVNQGAYGVAPCEADPSAELPDLRFICEMNRHDVAARVELVVVPRQRLLPHRVAAMLLHRDDEASLGWVPQPELPPSATGGTLVEQIASALAVAREDAGRSPVPFSPRESSRQAPLFEAWLTTERDGDRGGADRARMALLAGWDIDGPIVGADLFIGDAAAVDARAFVRRSLAGPTARQVLLADEADAFAVSAAEREAAITIFRMWHGDTEEVEAHHRRWAARLATERRQHGLSPMTELDDVLDLQQEADRVTAGELHPREALDNAMARLRGRLGRTVRGWYVEAHDPGWVVLPDAFLDSGATDVVLGVSYLRPPGAAWGQLVFFVCAVARE